MATQPEVIRQSELLNQLVLQRNTMEELGRIEVLWTYPPSHRVLGFVCKSGFMGVNKAAFKLSQLVALGENGILTHSQPEETTAEKVSKLDSVIHCEVWSDSGNKIGKVTDFVFNIRSGEITEYLFVSNGLSGITGEVYSLPPRQVLNFGRKRVLVSESAIKSLKLYREGIKQKIFKVGEGFKEDYTHATQELKSFTQQAQSATQKATGRFRNLAEQAKERAQALSQQAKEKVQNLGEQLKEEAQILAEQAKERSQELTEQLRERSQTLGKQVEEGIQTFTVQAEEIFDNDDDTFNASSTSFSDFVDRPKSESRNSVPIDNDNWVDDIFGSDTPQEEASPASVTPSAPPQTPSTSIPSDPSNIKHSSVFSDSSQANHLTEENSDDDDWWGDETTFSSSTEEVTPSSTETLPSTNDLIDATPPHSSTPQPTTSPSIATAPSPSTQKSQDTALEDDDDEPWI
jgi:uncharacterized protein YrrD/polyhydroxyalkanoate synthesis regulator phasin